MSTWSLSPQYKKSAVEKMFFYKDGKVITMEQGFRWATFKVESDERPLTDEELKNEDGYELASITNDESWEMWEMMDGCWIDIEAGNDKTTEEDVEAFTELWEEDNFEAVEGAGWSQDDCEYFYFGPLELTNEDTGEVFQGEPDNPIQQLDPEASISKAEIEEFIEGYAGVIENMSDEEWEDYGKEETLLTDWYPVSTNPVRNGMYQVLHEELEVSWPFQSNVSSAEWNGKEWSDKQVVKWRGLTEEVK